MAKRRKQRRQQNGLGGMLGVLKMGGAVPMVGATGLGIASQVQAVPAAATPAARMAAAQAAIPSMAYTGMAGMAGMKIYGMVYDVAEREMKKQKRRR